MRKKDFLDQFSTDDIPDSFKEEVLKPRRRKRINPKMIIIVSSIAIVLIAISIFMVIFLNRPKIVLPNFIGKKTSEVTSWLKQQEIEPSGIVYKEEYNEDFEEKIILNQSLLEGTKIKKDAKIDFIVSLGPDPNASIVVPDIASMNLTSIKNWIDDNKLKSVKINYEFSDIDPLDSVISFVFGGNASESSFTRTSSLTITVSKGKQSDQSISVPNFVNKNVSEVITWGSKNKIKVEQKEEYSSTVTKDLVIEQSVNVGKKISSKDILTVTVSRGEAIYAPDFSSYSIKNIDAWATKNLVNIEYEYKYSASIDKDKVISQDHKGIPVNDGMIVTISKGAPNFDSMIGQTKEDLEIWIKEINKEGAGITASHTNPIFDETAAPGTIIRISYSGSEVYADISRGRNIWLQDVTLGSAENGDSIKLEWSKAIQKNVYTEQEVRALIEGNPLITNVEYRYVTDYNCRVNHVVSITRSDGVILQKESYLPQDVKITVKICW